MNWHVDEINILPGADPYNVKILLDTNYLETHLSDYNMISKNLSGFRNIRTTENHWSGLIITSIELIKKFSIGNNKTRKTKTKNKYTQTNTTKYTSKKHSDIPSDQTIDICDFNTPSTISDLEFDDFDISQ